MLNGIFPVLCTPFNEDEDVDEMSLRRLIEYVLCAKVSGIVVGGVASEIFKLSSAERYQITCITIEQVAGRVPVIVGTSHDSVQLGRRGASLRGCGDHGDATYCHSSFPGSRCRVLLCSWPCD